MRRKVSELSIIIKEILQEKEELLIHVKELVPQIEQLQMDMTLELPSVQHFRHRANEAISRRFAVQKDLDRLRYREKLLTQREQLGVLPGYDSSTVIAKQTIDGTVLDKLSQVIEAELNSWEFPNASRVFFDHVSMDISVGGKSRGANGKGVCALLHGAFSIGLMKFCRQRNLPHPGFLLLDSLFIAYTDPDDRDNTLIKNSLLKDRAFSAFDKIDSSLQLIIIDNVKIPDWLASKPFSYHFSGKPGIGRVGFFPPLSQA